MTLVATLATAMAVQQMAQTEETTLVLNSDRMYLDAKAVESWAERLLIQDAQEVKNSGKSDIADSAIDVLPQNFSGLTVGHGFQVSGKIQDLQGKFNLNNLTNEKYEENLVNLILAVDPDIDAKQAKAIAVSVHDWVSKPKRKSNTNTTSTASAASDDNDSAGMSTPANSSINRHYTGRHPPYRAAQALMASASELRLITGMTPNLYVRLQPFVTALPRMTPININTASAPVIASLSSSIDLQTAMEMVQSRGDTPYSSLQDFMGDGAIQNANIPSANITMNSTYFLVSATVANSSEKMVLHAMLYRPLPTTSSANQASDSQNGNGQKANSQPMASILWESRGGV